MEEDDELIACAAFGVVQANLANLCKIMVDDEFAFRLHGNNTLRRSEALQAKTLRLIVRNINLHSQEGCGKRLALRVGH